MLARLHCLPVESVLALLHCLPVHASRVHDRRVTQVFVSALQDQRDQLFALCLFFAFPKNV